MLFLGRDHLEMGGALLAGGMIIYVAYYIGYYLSSVTQATGGKMYAPIVSMRVLNVQNDSSDIGVGLFALMLLSEQRTAQANEYAR